MNREVNNSDTKLALSKKEMEKSKKILKTIYEKKIAMFSGGSGTPSKNIPHNKANK